MTRLTRTWIQRVGAPLMLVIGPIVLLRRRRAGKRTHHIPVLVAEGRFSELVDDIADELERVTGKQPVVGALSGLWAMPMHTMRYAGERLFGDLTYRRLQAVKAAVDPDDVFRSNHPVRLPASEVRQAA